MSETQQFGGQDATALSHASEHQTPDTEQPASHTRRRLFLAGASAGAALLGGCGWQKRVQEMTGPATAVFVPLPADASAARTAAHVLNRGAWGPRPGDVAHVAQIGPAAWLEEQLADKMDEDPAVTWRVNGLDIQQIEENSPDLLSSMEDTQLVKETAQAAILRAVYSTHQLREVLADFWTNHFNIYALKSDGRILIPIDTERALRPHVLGTFRDMLFRSAHSPAMLTYLDNQENKRGVANENYARELLELHTLGVKSGYTLKDIQEVARCFTGWTVATGFGQGTERLDVRREVAKIRGQKVPTDYALPGFRYEDGLHDRGEKFIPFLNLRIMPNGGKRDADTVLETLVRHEATARFVARKLCRRFLGHAPDAVVEKAARAYLRSDSDIRATLRPILLDALTDPAENKPILKRPMDYAVSALRALGADTDGGDGVQKHLSDMGQPLYQWPMPDGFPEKREAWSGTLMPRWNFALALASNAVSGTSVDLNAPLAASKAKTDAQIVETLAETILNARCDSGDAHTLCGQVRTHVAKARKASLPDTVVLAEATGLFLASPGFQWK